MFNILMEPLIRMDAAAGLGIAASLPEIYAALMLDDDAFSALRPHQRHAWHAFLVQLNQSQGETRIWAARIREA